MESLIYLCFAADPSLLGPHPTASTIGYNTTNSSTISAGVVPSKPQPISSDSALPFGYPSNTALYIGLLALLKVVSVNRNEEPPRCKCQQEVNSPTHPTHTSQGRLYNLFDLFYRIDSAMVIGQIPLTIIRNLTYSMLSCHM